MHGLGAFEGGWGGTFSFFGGVAWVAWVAWVLLLFEGGLVGVVVGIVDSAVEVRESDDGVVIMVLLVVGLLGKWKRCSTS